MLLLVDNGERLWERFLPSLCACIYEAQKDPELFCLSYFLQKLQGIRAHSTSYISIKIILLSLKRKNKSTLPANHQHQGNR